MARPIRPANSTTARELSGCESLRDFVERLYAFALRAEVYDGGSPRASPLPAHADRDQLMEAVAELVAALLERAEELRSAGAAPDPLACARRALDELRRPDAGARVYRRSGLRRRVVQRIMQNIGWRGPLRLEVDPLSARPRLEQAGEAPDQAELPKDLGAIPDQILAEIKTQLDKAWEIVVMNARAGVCRQPKTARRRKAVLRYFSDRAQAGAEQGIVAAQLSSILDSTPPAEVIAALRAAEPAYFSKIKDKELRKDIQRVRAALREELPTLRSRELELRARFLAAWSRGYIESLAAE